MGCRMLEVPRLVQSLRLHWNVECWYYFIAHRFERSTPYTSLQPSLTMPWLVTSRAEMWMVKLHCKTQENQMTSTFKDEPERERERQRRDVYTPLHVVHCTTLRGLVGSWRQPGGSLPLRLVLFAEKYRWVEVFLVWMIEVIIQGAFCPRATAYVRVSVRACAEGGLKSGWSPTIRMKLYDTVGISWSGGVRLHRMAWKTEKCTCLWNLLSLL